MTQKTFRKVIITNEHDLEIVFKEGEGYDDDDTKFLYFRAAKNMKLDDDTIDDLIKVLQYWKRYSKLPK